MSSPQEAIRVEEQELASQEQAVGQMEEQLDAQETGIVQMEKSFGKRDNTLRNLQEYVASQESGLLTRAEAIGPKAKDLVAQTLAKSGADESQETGSIGLVDERQVLLERRREMLAMRMELVEEREQLYARRLESVEGAETSFSAAEDKLLAREKVIADTLRKLITQASELSGEDDDEQLLPGARAGPAGGSSAEGFAVPASRTATQNRPKSKGRLTTGPIEAAKASVMERRLEERDGMTVEHGRVDKPSSSVSPSGARTRAEGVVTRRRRGRARGGSSQFKITLEAVLGEGEKHTFFRYRADAATDLPGLFLATPNLLREGREVKLRIKIDAEAIDTRGVVSWRRQATDGQGPPGMGIEIAELSEDHWAHIGAFMKRVPPMVV